MFSAILSWARFGRFASSVLVVLCGLAQTSFAQDTKPPSPATTQPTSRPAQDDRNPSAEGFNADESDVAAIALADLTMKAMGGRQAWDETRYIAWNFFGSRRHIWDKHTGNVRIEWNDRESGEPIVVLMNIHTKVGRAWRNGAEIEEPEALAKMLQQGEGAWINDSYWLFMPYKLKDPGVTLKMIGRDKDTPDWTTTIIELTFKGVGRTPQNKYLVSIGRRSHLVEKWEFFAHADDDEPRFSTPWSQWKRYGRIMLSGDRGEMRGRPAKLTDIAVFDALPESIFTSPEPIDLSQFEQAPSDR